MWGLSLRGRRRRNPAYNLGSALQMAFSEDLVGGNELLNNPEEGPSTMPATPPPNRCLFDASTNVSQQGNTYNFGQSANAYLHYGANIVLQSSDTTDNVLQNMKRSRNAEFDIVENTTRGPCVADTRTGVIQKVMNWSKSEGPQLYWMSGIAGTGKTTISFSICDLLKTGKRLGASFFCSRSLPDCRDIRLIIPTVAHQLAQQFALYKKELITALEADSEISKRSLSTQLRKMIIDPWKSKQEKLPKNVVVVVDALDECEENHSSFLQLLFDNVTDLPFKIFLTSRPDFSILDTMKTIDAKILSRFILHEVEYDLVQADIAKYLQHRLSDRVPADVITYLQEISGSLFIVAATLSNWFIGGNINPRARLELLRTSLTTQKKMLASLDQVYKGVLRVAFDEERLWDIEVGGIKNVLFTIICARDPLTREAISGIWNVTIEEVDRRLDSLNSILSIPRDPRRSITVLHTSFPEFMKDPLRSKDFFCYPGAFNLKIAKLCLSLLDRQLHPNLCEVDGQPPNDCIGADVIDAHISPALKYASVYLVEHWILSDQHDRQVTLDSIREFFMMHLPSWFECLGLLGKLARSIEVLEMILNWLNEGSDLSALVYDSLRFIYHYYDLLENHATAIPSALAWIPIHSPLRILCFRLWQNVPRVLCGSLPDRWTGPERIIKIHSASVTCIAISQDRKRIASGSEDRVIRVWNTRLQIEECVLTGHTDQVRSIAIFRDGNRLVSGSHDRTLRIWDISTRQTLSTLRTSLEVASVAISQDEKWIASGNYDFVFVWDATSASLVHSLKGHRGWVYSISFIPSTPFLASASLHGTVRIWNMDSGKVERIFSDHPEWLRCMACSPAGDKIITGSSNNAYLWNIMGRKLQILRGHSSSILCVAFLKDGKRVITGSQDKTLRVWDAVTGSTLHTFTGEEEVLHIAGFEDGERIASSSGGPIAIWNIRSEAFGHQEVTQRLPSGLYPGGAAKSISFSSNGRRALLIPYLRIPDIRTLDEIATIGLGKSEYEYQTGVISASGSRVAASQSVSGDYKITVWEVTDEGSVTVVCILKGHTHYLNALEFSQDGRQLLSASAETTARLWDLDTGSHVCLNHPKQVENASFSQAGTRIVSVSGSFPGTIHVWDVLSRQQLTSFFVDDRLFGCTNIAFTLDGHLHIITYRNGTTRITTVQAYHDPKKQEVSQRKRPDHQYKEYHYWTVLEDGTSYALHNSGWVYHFLTFDSPPHKVVLIPSPHLPGLSDKNLRISGPVFTTPSSNCVQICLPSQDRLLTLVVPHAH